ncbi:uncharacterized protein TNCT_328571 [Trichonephila clavata]|uniref:Uncharacterized protein n=1 Tax=Trichonephila clavata TaxID=2740835 RepID=A0A8X6FKK2_TRICU|nr:uncharacterized protein TNCT_328571 [Trichonephila clavata]
MSSLGCFAVFFYCAGLVLGGTTNETKSLGNGTEKGRDGRWLGDNEHQYSVQLGYYASPDAQVYAADDSEERNDKVKYSLPTSFADFKPDTSEDKKSRYTLPKAGPPPSAWKGVSGDDLPAPWMFPSDMVALMNAAAVEEKPTGLLAKLKSEPIVVLLAAVVPLSLLLAAVLPSLIKTIMAGSMTTPPATTTATGNEGRKHRGDDPSYIASVLKAIENVSILNGQEDLCLQKVVCQVVKGIEGTKYRSVQENVFEMLPLVPEVWLEKFGLKEVKEVLKNGSCESVKCSKKAKSSSEKKRYNSTTSYKGDKDLN